MAEESSRGRRCRLCKYSLSNRSDVRALGGGRREGEREGEREGGKEGGKEGGREERENVSRIRVCVWCVHACVCVCVSLCSSASAYVYIIIM